MGRISLGQWKTKQREDYIIVNEIALIGKGICLFKEKDLYWSMKDQSNRRIWTCQWKTTQREGHELVNKRPFKEKDTILSIKPIQREGYVVVNEMLYKEKKGTGKWNI